MKRRSLWWLCLVAFGCSMLTAGRLAAVANAEEFPETVAATEVFDPFARLRSPHVGPDDEYWSVVGDELRTIATLEGAVYDSDFGVLVLSGPPATKTGPFHLDDLMVALRAQFLKLDSLGMTIDPDPMDPHGPIQSVKYFGGAEDTAFGWVMFECDRLLKSYSGGRDNLSEKELKPDIADFHIMAVLRASFREDEQQNGNRFWLTFDPKNGSSWRENPNQSNGYQPLIALSADRRAMRFERYRIFLGTQVMQWKYGKLVPAATTKSKAAEQFANHFTAHFADFAKIDPVLERLEHLGKLVVLAEWIQQTEVPVDLQFVRHYQQRVPVITPRITPAVHGVTTRVKDPLNLAIVHELQSIGGVDLRSAVLPIADKDGKAAQLKDLVRRELVSHHHEVAWTATTDAGPIRFVAIPTLAMGLKSSTGTTPVAAQLQYNGKRPASTKKPVQDQLLPEPPSVAQSDRGQLVSRAIIDLSSLDAGRERIRGPPRRDLGPEAVLMDVRHFSKSERAELVSAERRTLEQLSSLNVRARGPPDKTAIDSESLFLAESDRTAIVGRASEPLETIDAKRNGLPRGPPAAGSSDAAADKSPSSLFSSDRSEVVAREKTSLADLIGVTANKAQPARVKVSASSNKQLDDPNKPVGLTLFRNGAGLSTFALPQLVQFDDPKVSHGFTGSPEEFPDALALVSELGDIHIAFNLKKLVSLGKSQYFQAEGGPPGLIGYSPSRRTVAFEDGLQIRFDNAGHPREVHLPDGRLLKLSYPNRPDKEGHLNELESCTLSAADGTTAESFRLVANKAKASKPIAAPATPVAVAATRSVTPVPGREASRAHTDSVPPAQTQTTTDVLPESGKAVFPTEKTNSPTTVSLQRLAMPAAVESNDSVLLEAIRLPSSGTPCRWKAVLRLVRTSKESARNPEWRGDTIQFANSRAGAFKVSLQFDSGSAAPGEVIELRAVVSHSADAAAGQLPQRAQFWIDVHQTPTEGSGEGTIVSVPVQIEPYRQPAGYGGAAFFGILAVAVSVFLVMMWRAGG